MQSVKEERLIYEKITNLQKYWWKNLPNLIYKKKLLYKTENTCQNSFMSHF